MMRLHTQDSTVFHAFVALLLLLAPALSGVAAQSSTSGAQSGAPSDVPNPFKFYNATLEIGSTGYVSWDLNSFSGPINLWVRENYPNASRPHIPLSSANTVGYMLWELSVQTDFDPGLYYFEIQSTSGEGVIYKSNPWSIICAECPYPTSTSAAPTSTSSISHSTYPTAYTSSTTSNPGSTGTGSPATAISAKSSSLSPGAAAGIGAGGAAVLGIVALLIWLRFRKFQRRRRERQNMAPNPQPWVPPPLHHIGDSPEMTTYSSSPGYKPPGHSRQWSQELHGSGQQSAPQSPHPAHGQPDFPKPFTSQPGSPAPQPPYHPQSPTQTAAPVARSPPQPYHPPPQPNQPWINAVPTPEGNAFPPPSWEGSPRSDQEGFQNQHGSPESQQGLFSRRAAGS